MKKRFWICIAMFLAITFFAGYGCKKDEDNESLPTLVTLGVSNITNTSVVSGVEIKDKGEYEIIRQGLCWSTLQNPTIADSHVTDNLVSDSFSATVTGLLPNTKYYLRAFATNYKSTGYGNEIVFQTTGSTPVLETNSVVVKTYNSIACGGMITSDAGGQIVSKGVCWSENPEPSITDSKAVSTQEGNTYSCFVQNLKSNTKYYIRAYATNSVGTNYGSVKSFTLWLNYQESPLKDIEGNEYKSVRVGEQVWMQENLRTTKFQDGTSLTTLNLQSEWNEKNAPGYYVNVDNVSFGYIYNGYAISANKNICPAGWHIPTQAEWETLINYLGGYSVAGDLMKGSATMYWGKSGNDVYNLSGFTALPNGYVGSDGTSHDKLQDASFFVSTFDAQGNPSFSTIESDLSSIQLSQTSSKVSGVSIRCIKD
jgi:Fibrobacter succinogenes major domain (Fib_succ_major).